MKVPSLLLCAATAFLAPPEARAIAFDGAQGYGANATGGTAVVHVTNLNDAGPGSLRAALDGPGHHVVFDIAGTITIASALVIPSETTLDGTTAPPPGITVTGHSTSVSGQNNIILRNLRFRETMSGPPKKCALQGADACHDILVDHCSIEQGRWDCLEFTDGSHDITVQWSIIGEGIDPQKFGFLVNGLDRVSIHHNLFVDNQSRNPKLKGNCQYINNVVYNWGSGGGLVGGHSAAVWRSDIINNVFVAGPSSKGKWLSMCTATDNFYVAGNEYDLKPDGIRTLGPIPAAAFAAEGVTLQPAIFHHPPAAITVDAPTRCLDLATAGAFGCQPLDAADQRLCGYVKSLGTQGQIGAPQ